MRTRFGKNVARLRTARGLSQEKLAEKADLSVRYIQSIEAGEAFPYLPPLSRLCKVLKASWNDLLEGC